MYNSDLFTSKHISIIVVSRWNTNLMSDYAPILYGGMSFAGTEFTVPDDGIYYIYGMIMIEHDGVETCGFTLDVGADRYLIANDQSINGAQQSLFGSQVRKLKTGNRVSMTTRNCIYNFGLDRAFFGIYKLQRGF